MRLRHLKIENFRGVSHFECDLGDGMNAFVGVNGSGKTTILNAIEILFSWFVARMRSESGKGYSLKDDDIKDGEEYCNIEGRLETGISWSVYKQRSYSHRVGLPQKSDLFAITEYARECVGRDVDSVPLIAFYDVLRMVDSVPLRVRKRHAMGMTDVYNEGIKGRTNFNSFFVWFREKEDIENENLRETGFLTKDGQLETVRRAMEGTVRGFRNLKVRRMPMGFVVDKDGVQLRFDALSDGEKSYITLVADIARKLSMTHPHMSNPLESEGVIIIDEIDLHLHPAWQREILPQLKQTFPNCQFIISTHSPFVLSNVYLDVNNRLFAVSDGSATPMSVNLYGAQVDKVLREAQGMSSVRGVAVQEHIDKIWFLLKQPRVDDSTVDQELLWLKNHLEPSDEIFAQIAIQRLLKR